MSPSKGINLLDVQIEFSGTIRLHVPEDTALARIREDIEDQLRRLPYRIPAGSPAGVTVSVGKLEVLGYA